MSLRNVLGAGIGIGTAGGRPSKSHPLQYGHMRHFQPLHTSFELRLLKNNEREAAEDEGHRNKGPRVVEELSFNNIVQKLMHTDYFASHTSVWRFAALNHVF
jgi:hypothetical protein